MRALTVGGAMIDTIAIIDSERIERMAMFNAESSFLLLEEGGKTEAKNVSTHCGGGAVNAAIAMSRLGLDMAAMVKLGRDARAEVLLARLMEEGGSCRWAVRSRMKKRCLSGSRRRDPREGARQEDQDHPRCRRSLIDHAHPPGSR